MIDHLANAPLPRFFVIGEVVADSERRVLLRHGELVKVEPKVMALLTYLAANAGRIVPKDELLARVWNGAHVVDEALQRAVSMLRTALGDGARNPRLVETVPTRGYRLMVMPRPLEEPVAPISAGFAGSRPLVLLITALLTGLLLGAGAMLMRERPLSERLAPEAPEAETPTPYPAGDALAPEPETPTPSPTPRARAPQPAPPARQGAP
jgi:DNA-binding winged helix-turn-helix (wHTH) protein